MTRTFLAVSALLAVSAVSHAAGAQVPGAAAKAAAKSAVAATNAHIEAEQTTDQRKPAAKSSPEKVVERPGSKLDIGGVDTTGTPPVILRERYGYVRDGKRDPFVSLLTTNELRPTMSDLRLTGILYDQGGGHSVATLRDLGTNASYRVSTGSTLGRMRVAAIRLKTIVFTIDEFGTTRQDSLVIGDTTKVRGK
jgi:hypothetical protein